MTPGPTQVIACPHCHALESYGTVKSGNTFGAVLYSDTKRVAPHLPQRPSFVECHACRETYWLEDASELGSFSPWAPSPGEKINPAWKNAPAVRAPGEEKYYDAIDRMAASPSADRLRELRLLAWHAQNDPYRANDAPPFALSPRARENLQNLTRELEADPEPDPNNLLLIAELQREQGEFDSALLLLDRTDWGDLKEIAAQIRNECVRQNSRVFELVF
jgi:hypothetical protein